jgi:hypothetical protein
MNKSEHPEGGGNINPHSVLLSFPCPTNHGTNTPLFLTFGQPFCEDHKREGKVGIGLNDGLSCSGLGKINGTLVDRIVGCVGNGQISCARSAGSMVTGMTWITAESNVSKEMGNVSFPAGW